MSTTELHRLPDLPVGIRLLSNAESDRLETLRPDARRSVRNCITCGGTRTFRWWSDDTRSEVVDWECPCEEQWILYRYMLWSGVGTAYQRYGWADASGVEPGAITAVNDWLSNSPQNVRSGLGLLLSGGMGTGKTMLALLMLKRLLGDGYNGYFTTFSDMISTLMTSWRSESERIAYHALCRNSGVLVVDDVGQEMKKTVVRTDEDGRKELARVANVTSEFALESVLRHRIANAKPTIITTNLTVEQLRQVYGDHFKSLLTESMSLYPFSGRDYRGQAKMRQEEENTLGLIRPLVIG